MIGRADITGVVLAGGRAARMGGVDKGLQPYAASTLAAHAAQRLRPHVSTVAINANRELERHALHGFDVWPDGDGATFRGPLAGMLSGLRRATTPWVACVPCDAPCLPFDLVHRLARAVDPDPGTVDVAIAATIRDGEPRLEPACCLLRCRLATALASDLERGERRAGEWLSRQRHVVVVFDDVSAFANANTFAELESLRGRL